MENRQILALLIALLLNVPVAACATQPTAIVIDAETGRPVEGAIALAQWWEPVPLGLGLGTSARLAKSQETYSDKDGHVFIDDFWSWGWFSTPNAQLSVYKPGYVLWDSKKICPVGNRTDFDKDHRTAKLLKFDTEAARWLKEYPERFRSVGLHQEHLSYYNLCDLHSKKMDDLINGYELPLIKKERLEAIRKKSNEGLR